MKNIYRFDENDIMEALEKTYFKNSATTYEFEFQEKENKDYYTGEKYKTIIAHAIPIE